MTARLDELRAMRDFIDREIAVARIAEIKAIRDEPVVEQICTLYDIGFDAIALGLRSHKVSRARHAVVWALHRRGWSLTDLAGAFECSRNTVCKALQRVERDTGMRALLLGLEGAA